MQGLISPLPRYKDMKQTTLCYIERDGKYLLIHRTKKQGDENRDKWIGIGGKIEEGESPFDCIRREAFEETGLELTSLSYRGIVTFVSDIYGTEYMHLFHSTDFSGIQKDTSLEGDLKWVEKKQLLSLPMWEGDRIFLDLLDKKVGFFSLKLVYQGDRLLSHTLEF